MGPGSYPLGLSQEVVRLARRIERALMKREPQRSRRRASMGTDQCLRLEIPDLDLKIVDAN